MLYTPNSWGGATHSPHTQAAPISVLKASTAYTAFTAWMYGVTGPSIQAVNAVHTVEALNTDIGTAWVWGLWVVPPNRWYPPNWRKCVFQHMYPRSVLEASTASTAFTAYREGPVTPYIHALNAVDAVEASNSDRGYIYWKTHFIQLEGITCGGIPPIAPTPK